MIQCLSLLHGQLSVEFDTLNDKAMFEIVNYYQDESETNTYSIVRI